MKKFSVVTDSRRAPMYRTDYRAGASGARCRPFPVLPRCPHHPYECSRGHCSRCFPVLTTYRTNSLIFTREVAPRQGTESVGTEASARPKRTPQARRGAQTTTNIPPTNGMLLPGALGGHPSRPGAAGRCYRPSEPFRGQAQLTAIQSSKEHGGKNGRHACLFPSITAAPGCYLGRVRSRRAHGDLLTTPQSGETSLCRCVSGGRFWANLRPNSPKTPIGKRSSFASIRSDLYHPWLSRHVREVFYAVKEAETVAYIIHINGFALPVSRGQGTRFR